MHTQDRAKQLTEVAKLIRNASTHHVLIEAARDRIFLTIDTAISIELTGTDYIQLVRQTASSLRALPETLEHQIVEYQNKAKPYVPAFLTMKAFHTWDGVYLESQRLEHTQLWHEHNGYKLAIYTHPCNWLTLINDKYVSVLENAGDGYQEEPEGPIYFPTSAVRIVCMPAAQSVVEECKKRLSATKERM